jgi:hypothetical protein
MNTAKILRIKKTVTIAEKQIDKMPGDSMQYPPG